MDLNAFFAMIFEWGGMAFRGSFSNELYAEGLYLTVGLISSIVSLFLVLLFYFIINRPSFSRWQHWAIMLFINFIINFVVGFFVPQNVFNSLGNDFEIMEYISFGLIASLTTTVFFVIWTYCFKWWKGNAKGTPKLFFGKF